MKVGDLKEMLKDVDDNMDIVVVERPMAGVEDIVPLRFVAHENKWRIEAKPEDSHYVLETIWTLGEDSHCCTECGHWSPMDGKCSVNGELYHGWETACDRFVMETDTR